jgi:hypothetical protein
MGWDTQIDNYFSLHGITDELSKIRYVVFYLDHERWKWWKCHKNSSQGYISWTHSIAKLYDHFDIDSHLLGRLKKLKQSGIVEDFITSFENLDF